MYVSARTDYAMRAMLAIAADPAGGMKAARLADIQRLPLSFLQGILLDLRRAGLLVSRRGSDGGYALARPATDITVGDVLRAANGGITTVRGQPAEHATYHGAAAGLRDVWLSVSGAIEGVVDVTSLAGLLPQQRTAEQTQGPAARRVEPSDVPVSSDSHPTL